MRARRLRACLLFALVLGARASAQCFTTEIVPALPPAAHGSILALSGDDLVCADNRFDAYFFESTPAGWVETARFFIGPPITGGLYPSVAIDGDLAVVGNPDAFTSAGQVAGEVLVFEKSATGWVHVATLHASDAVEWSEYGWCVAVQGEEIFVSAPHVLFPTGPPTIYVYGRGGSGWVERQRISATTLWMDVDGDTLVSGNGVVSSSTGRADVFERTAAGWNSVAWLQAPDGAPGDWFGVRVAVSGETILAGAPGSLSSNGSAHVFDRVQGVWTFTQKLTLTQGGYDARFGTALDLRGGRALIGAHAFSSYDGTVRVYERLGSDFEEIGKLVSPSNADDQQFGSTVVLDEGVALSGAAGEYNGKLYAFALGAEERRISCDATANSTGMPARMHQLGCPALSSTELTLLAGPLPPQTTCVLFFGTPGIQRPLFDGVMCVARPLSRFAPRPSDATGMLVQELDFSNPPGRFLTAGTTWAFQAIFADPAAGGSGFNLTDAIALTFEP